ncbi:hypothetical protein RMS36_001790 [Campylobacter coli]|nr:hypothetical protein [Campylobacter coli]ELE6068030.1 hypothetical protein [Campylobacter coli]
MKKICIFGSCVSRDIFEYDEQKHFELVGYYARSSFTSLSSNAMIEQDVLDNIISPFQKRMVLYDMNKSFIDRIKRNDFDCLLIDFIDDRFHFYKLSNDSIVTLSNEYKKAKGKLYSSNMIYSKSQEHIDLWKKGIEKVYDDLYLIQDKIILNKVYWTDVFVTGDKLKINEEYLADNNVFLKERYDDFAKFFPEVKCIEYSQDLLILDHEHKWGGGSHALSFRYL